jgi:hypothetical protein
MSKGFRDVDRICWLEEERGPIKFLPDSPAVVVDRATLREMLPAEESLAYFTSHLHYDNRPICPVPFSYHPDLVEALQLEADLDSWGLRPISAEQDDWPAGLLDTLRHVRGMKGVLQNRHTKKLKADA